MPAYFGISGANTAPGGGSSPQRLNTAGGPPMSAEGPPLLPAPVVGSPLDPPCESPVVVPEVPTLAPVLGSPPVSPPVVGVLAPPVSLAPPLSDEPPPLEASPQAERIRQREQREQRGARRTWGRLRSSTAHDRSAGGDGQGAYARIHWFEPWPRTNSLPAPTTIVGVTTTAVITS